MNLPLYILLLWLNDYVLSIFWNQWPLRHLWWSPLLSLLNIGQRCLQSYWLSFVSASIHDTSPSDAGDHPILSIRIIQVSKVLSCLYLSSCLCSFVVVHKNTQSVSEKCPTGCIIFKCSHHLTKCSNAPHASWLIVNASCKCSPCIMTHSECIMLMVRLHQTHPNIRRPLLSVNISQGCLQSSCFLCHCFFSGAFVPLTGRHPVPPLKKHIRITLFGVTHISLARSGVTHRWLNS